jgi:hypothetical protein
MVSAPAEPRLLTRLGPALLLVVLAPIVAEFLLADFTIRNLPLLVALIPLYGCGALLIREVARRAQRGWPTIVLLAFAYALLEEAFLTQSLFNPNYVNQRLLDYGFIPALGTSLNWTFFVLSIHVVWSVATPILIAEGVAAERRTVPWLRRLGLGVTIVIFLLGCVSTAAFSLKSSPFVASGMQFAIAGALIALTIVLAFAAFDGRDAPPAPPPSPQAPPLPVVSLVTLFLASAYLAGEGAARARDLPPAVPVVFRLACEATAITLFAVWSSRRGWNALHYLAIATGTTLTYFLFGLNVVMRGHTNLGAPTNAVDVVGHIGLGVGVLALIVWAARRNVIAAGLHAM